MKPIKNNFKATTPKAAPAKEGQPGIANQTKAGAANGCMSTGGWK